MAYLPPRVEVYQILKKRSVPLPVSFLPFCIVGPAYRVTDTVHEYEEFQSSTTVFTDTNDSVTELGGGSYEISVSSDPTPYVLAGDQVTIADGTTWSGTYTVLSTTSSTIIYQDVAGKGSGGPVDISVSGYRTVPYKGSKLNVVGKEIMPGSQDFLKRAGVTGKIYEFELNGAQPLEYTLPTSDSTHYYDFASKKIYGVDSVTFSLIKVGQTVLRKASGSGETFYRERIAHVVRTNASENSVTFDVDLWDPPKTKYTETRSSWGETGLTLTDNGDGTVTVTGFTGNPITDGNIASGDYVNITNSANYNGVYQVVSVTPTSVTFGGAVSAGNDTGDLDSVLIYEVGSGKYKIRVTSDPTIAGLAVGDSVVISNSTTHDGGPWPITNIEIDDVNNVYWIEYNAGSAGMGHLSPGSYDLVGESYDYYEGDTVGFFKDVISFAGKIKAVSADEDDYVPNSTTADYYPYITDSGVLLPGGITDRYGNQVKYGIVHFTYTTYNRILNMSSTLVNKPMFYTNISQVEEMVGDIRPENPLAYALMLALASGRSGYGLAISEDSFVGYNKAFEALKEVDVFGIVPLTEGAADDVFTSLKAHLEFMNSGERSMWRIGIISGENQPYETEIVSTMVGDAQYGGVLNAFKPSEPASCSPELSLVETGDILRIDDVDNPELNGDYEIVSIDKSCCGGSGACYFEVSPSFYLPKTRLTAKIVRQNSAYFIAQDAKNFASSIGYMNIVNIFPDKVKVEDPDILPGWAAAASLAGYISANPGPEPYNEVSLPGISRVYGSNDILGYDELNLVAEGGNLILYHAGVGALPTIREQLTTDMTSDLTSQLSLVVNRAVISKTIKNAANAVKGKNNITQDFLDAIKLITVQILNSFKARPGGYRIIDYQNLTVEAEGSCVIVKADITMAAVGKVIKFYLNFSI